MLRLFKKYSLIGLCWLASCADAATLADMDFSSTSIQKMTTSSQMLIFMSFAMPSPQIRQWLAEAHRIDAHIIIRGLRNDSFQDTQTYLSQLDPKGETPIVLDPQAFVQYQISQVPAVVMRNMDVRCPAHQSCQESYDVVYGDSGLEAALRLVANDHQSAHANIALHALQQLRSRP